MDAEQALRVRPNRPRLEQLTHNVKHPRWAVTKETLQLGWVVTAVREAQSLSTGSLGVLRSRAAVPGFDDRYEPQ